MADGYQQASSAAEAVPKRLKLQAQCWRQDLQQGVLGGSSVPITLR